VLALGPDSALIPYGAEYLFIIPHSAAITIATVAPLSTAAARDKLLLRFWASKTRLAAAEQFGITRASPCPGRLIRDENWIALISFWSICIIHRAD
jgi:hypothetical protein